MEQSMLRSKSVASEREQGRCHRDQRHRDQSMERSEMSERLQKDQSSERSEVSER